ncbi:hypothetical protein D6U18_05605 [Lactiplantibacillus pentosus]|uniref:Uncharacterized protein n=2 Tax=Lactiplantibacillus pentosus TaxID=1589 RepID=A0ABD7ITZ9_LACPE|nr:hypothetical protein D6U18_05605 [Lactiplantibacillus pentosus]
MKQDLNVRILRPKAASGGPLENGANIRKLAAIGPSYAGFQAFLTTLERDGHRFKPTTHVLNTGLPLTKPKTLAKWNFIAEHCQKRPPAADGIRKADMCALNF